MTIDTTIIAALLGALGVPAAALMGWLTGRRRTSVDVGKLESELRVSLLAEIKECQDGHTETRKALAAMEQKYVVAEAERLILVARVSALEMLNTAANLAAANLAATNLAAATKEAL